MNTYEIDLTYPKASRQPVYSIRLDAHSSSQAEHAAKMAAVQEGWKGQALKVKVRIVEELK